MRYKFPFLNESLFLSNFFKKNLQFSAEFRLPQNYESHEEIPANATFSAQNMFDSNSYSQSNKSKYTKDVKRIKRTLASVPKMVNKRGPLRVFFFISGNDSKLDSANSLGIVLNSIIVKYKLRFQYKVYYESVADFSGSDVLNQLLYKMISVNQSANNFANFNLVKSGIVVGASGQVSQIKEFALEEDLSVTVVDDRSFYVDLQYDDSGTKRNLPLLAKSLLSDDLECKSIFLFFI